MGSRHASGGRWVGTTRGERPPRLGHRRGTSGSLVDRPGGLPGHARAIRRRVALPGRELRAIRRRMVRREPRTHTNAQLPAFVGLSELRNRRNAEILDQPDADLLPREGGGALLITPYASLPPST